jgi:hypothetical protein
MNRRYTLWSTVTAVAVLLLVVALTGFSTASAQANKPELPTLSLTGERTDWKTNYYPDGRVWTSKRGANGDRTILVPVFIVNCWRTTTTFEAFPIYSMKFKVQYDSTALEFMGVEKNGPRTGPQNTPISCLARDFNFSTSVARDVTYQSVINAPTANRLRGKRAMISATSSKPLPQTGDINSPCDQRPMVELCYLRFKVIADPAANPVSARTPIILTNDTLYYNDFRVGYELPFPFDPAPSEFAGLGGVDNYFIDQFQQQQVRDPLRPSKPGMLWVEVTDLIPRLSFTNVADRRLRLVDSVDNSNGTDWFVTQPIVVDSGARPFYEDQVNGYGTRDIDVINAVSGTRLYDLVVKSDQRWLRFKSFSKGGIGEITPPPFPQPVREGYVQFMDKGILGTTLGITPQANNTILQRDLNFRIICDANELANNPQGDNEEAGIYVGNITFTSNSLEVSPVKVKVTFIYFRPPFEPNIFDENDSWQRFPGGQRTAGITLEVRNSNNPVERTYVTMGTGARATQGVDLLFGEGQYVDPLNSFGARWYPRFPDGNLVAENGLSDLFPDNSTRPRGGSRDIRDIYTDTTLVYFCRFNAGSALNYPIVISWDTLDFPPGSDLFIRDTLNGSRFNQNMRFGTSLGGTRQSFTIRDADITAFIVEYTLPKVAQFPVINRGWNLLSLPVNPSSSFYRDIFRNGLNIPVRFAQNSYQENETTLEPGVGYFVKYADQVDRTIAGSRVFRIDEQNFPTRLYEGWNTIGSLSTNISTENVDLIAISSNATIAGDIYRYVTDRGYVAVTEIQPGLGYWMKIDGQAFLQMVATSRPKQATNRNQERSGIINASTRVDVLDAKLRTATLYISDNSASTSLFELPPTAPHNLFDVRFASNTYVETANNPVIKLQGTDYPVNVVVYNPESNYSVVDAVSGEVLGTILAGRTNVVTIDNKNTKSVRLMNDTRVTETTVSVSPNPAHASSQVTVQVAAGGTLSVTVYNTVGAHVATIGTGVVQTGSVARYELGNLPTGTYIVKATINGASVSTPVTVVR